MSQNLSAAFADGIFLKDGPPTDKNAPSAPNPLSDPAAMEGMMAGMKTQMVMMVPQMVIMGWVNFFFQGFVLSACIPYFPPSFLRPLKQCAVKLPFPLTLGFKSMLQRGIETPDMDVRWVSSLSWYFLNFFGLNGLYQLMLGGEQREYLSQTHSRAVIATLISFSATAVSQDITVSPFAAAGTAQPGQAQDFVKLFKAERDNLEFAEGVYSWVGEGVEDRVLRKHGKLS
jgi:ER membrane protein complex subunit 3